MQRLLAPLALALAACTSHPGFEVIDSCPSCARGDVAGGAIVRSDSIAWAARPGGGWVRADDHDLVWADPAFHIDHETDVDIAGDVDVLAVGPDDTAYIDAHTNDDQDFYEQLAAIAPDGSVRWRLEPMIVDEAAIRMKATADAVFLYGIADYGVSIAGQRIDGVFVVCLDPGTGAMDWTWSSPSGGPSDLEVVPRADGSLAVAGTVGGYSTLGAPQFDLAGVTAPLTLGTNPTTGFVGTLDASGHGAWVRTFTGPDRTRAYQVGLMDDGAIAIAGDFSDISGKPLDLGNGVVIPTGGAPYEDQFVGVLESAGTTRWAIPLGDGLAEQVHSLATLGDAIVVAGRYEESPLSFGDGIMPVKFDAFIASVTSGAVDWVTEAHGPEDEAATVVGRAGALDAVVRNPTTIQNAPHSGPRSFDVGRVHVAGDDVLFANLIP